MHLCTILVSYNRDPKINCDRIMVWECCRPCRFPPVETMFKLHL